MQSSLAGDNHTTTSALCFLDIACVAKPESYIDDTKVMQAQPTKE